MIAQKEQEKWTKDKQYDPTRKAIACQVIGGREYHLFSDGSGLQTDWGHTFFRAMKDFYTD